MDMEILVAVLDNEYSKRIKEHCMNGNLRLDHALADDLIMELLDELGFLKTIDAFNNVSKSYA